MRRAQSGRGVLGVVLALFAAACSGGPSYVGHDAKAASGKVANEIGSAVSVEPSDPTTPPTTTATVANEPPHYPPGVSFRAVDGIELYLDATGTRDWHQGLAVELALSVRNRTKHAIGYLTDKESHFSLVDSDGGVLWNDATCRTQPHGQIRTGYLELEPGEAVTIADYYPTRPGNKTAGCEARPGPATLVAALTVCRDLPDDWMCPAGRAERVAAEPLAVTVP